jgi:hypothetical protein
MLASFFLTILLHMYLEISISQSRLVEFIHIFLQEYRETKIVLVFLFLKLKS